MRPPLSAPEFRCWKASDGYELRGRLWHPGSSYADYAVIYLHGIQSHGGWFEWSASVLAQNGVPVLLPDRRGSGLNRAARGDTPRAQRWLDDIDDVWEWAVRELGVRRLALVGVSWGGKLAAAYALARPTRVERMLLVAPGIFPAVDIGLVARLRVGFLRLVRPASRVKIPLDDPALFTADPAGQAFIRDDPLKLTHATARFMCASAQLDWRLRRARRGSLRVEIAVALAGRDRIIRNAPTERRLRNARPGAVPTTRFSDACHTLEFEPNTDGFYQLLTSWAQA